MIVRVEVIRDEPPQVGAAMIVERGLCEDELGDLDLDIPEIVDELLHG